MKKAIWVLMVLALVGCGKAETEAAPPPAQPADYMSIGLNEVSFKDAFNQEALRNNSAFRIFQLRVTPSVAGPQFTYQFNQNIQLLGTINSNDGTIRSLTTMAATDGTKNSAIQILLIMHDIIRATNPTLPESETSRLGIALFNQAVKTTGEPVEDVRNGIRYAAMFQKGFGMIFVADQKR